MTDAYHQTPAGFCGSPAFRRREKRPWPWPFWRRSGPEARLRFGSTAIHFVGCSAWSKNTPPRPATNFTKIVGHLATEAARGGVTVVVSATAPRRHHRDRVRAAVDDFVEVLLVCGRKRLLERDPKGLYLKAHHGEIQNFPGVSAAFESPAKAELVLDTGRIEPVQAVDAILRTLDARATKRPMTEVPPTVTKPYHDSA